MPQPSFYRRSPHLVCYWNDGKLVFHNYAAGTQVVGDPLLCEILDFFGDWRSEEQFLEQTQLRASTARRLLRALEPAKFLERRGAGAARNSDMPSWNGWNPAAGFYHFSTKDAPYSRDAAGVSEWLRTRARETPPPKPAKRYLRAKQIALPPPQSQGEFPQVLLNRRTWRRFSPRPVALRDLATMLWLSCGVQWWIPLPDGVRVPLKTHPSAGARHPLEIYVLARRVSGLPPGLYHYAADAHRLELIRKGATSAQIGRYLPAQPGYKSAAALLLITAVFPRVQWKYQDPRAYRTVLLDAGHLCQNFCLVATWAKLAPFCTMALADSKIEKDLGIDGVNESVLYAAGLGSRPEGAEWAPLSVGSLKRSAATAARRRRKTHDAPITGKSPGR